MKLNMEMCPNCKGYQTRTPEDSSSHYLCEHCHCMLKLTMTGVLKMVADFGKCEQDLPKDYRGTVRHD